jgi:methionine-rich copper-binding protein CopC
VTLNDPGSLLRGIVNLSARAPSAAVASVDFERRSAGGSWTRIVLDAARPWGATFDTTSLGDGVYDLRATALNSGGQPLAVHSLEGVGIDNTAPTMLSATPANGSVVSSVKSIALVASEPVASVQATLDGSAATSAISGSNVTFTTGALGAGKHALTGNLVDAAGNMGAFTLKFEIEVEAHATLILKVKKPKAKSRGKNRVFSVPLTLSTPARVQATLLSPSGRRLRTLRTKLSAGGHTLRFILPAASLPPGRYTILVVATGADGSKVVKRVRVKIAAAKIAKKRAARQAPKSVVTPVAPSSGPPSDSTGSPDASTPPPAVEAKSKTRAPRSESRPLETASGYVSSKPGRTAGLMIVLLGMGLALAFLIKIEMGRMLASPRR